MFLYVIILLFFPINPMKRTQGVLARFLVSYHRFMNGDIKYSHLIGQGWNTQLNESGRQLIASCWESDCLRDIKRLH